MKSPIVAVGSGKWRIKSEIEKVEKEIFKKVEVTVGNIGFWTSYKI